MPGVLDLTSVASKTFYGVTSFLTFCAIVCRNHFQSCSSFAPQLGNHLLRSFGPLLSNVTYEGRGAVTKWGRSKKGKPPSFPHPSLVPAKIDGIVPRWNEKRSKVLFLLP